MLEVGEIILGARRNYWQGLHSMDLVNYVRPPYDDRHYAEGEDVDLMQYTGLLDKNGVEIYEGDIVRVQHPLDMSGDFRDTVGGVFWWKEEGGWYHGNSNGRPPKRMWQYCEIIGNVWEHPDLIKLKEGN